MYSWSLFYFLVHVLWAASFITFIPSSLSLLLSHVICLKRVLFWVTVQKRNKNPVETDRWNFNTAPVVVFFCKIIQKGNLKRERERRERRWVVEGEIVNVVRWSRFFTCNIALDEWYDREWGLLVRTNVSAQRREGNKKNVCRGNYDDDAEFSFSKLPIGVDSR